MWALARLDYDVLEEHLAQWNPATTDPVWMLRKAGILAEIDRDLDAISLLRDALTVIRRHRCRDLDDLPALSREAWALWLVMAYRHGFSRRTGTFTDTPEPFDRWRELAVHHCDAYSEYNSLRAELEQVGDKPLGSIVKEPDFDLGHEWVFFRLQVEPMRPQVRASYQMLRLAEVTGLPHRANHVSLLTQELCRAADTLADAEPWSASLRMIRFMFGPRDEILRKFFTRSRIALYSEQHIEGLIEVLLCQIRCVIPRCQENTAARSGNWVNRLAVAVEILSRITLRLSPDQARVILERAIEFYRSDAFVRQHSLAEPLGNLLKRAIETLPPEALCTHLPALFNLPVAFESAFQPFAPHWPEPIHFVPDHPLFKAPTNIGREPVWNQIVARLTRVVGESEPEARERALYRLYRLHQWELLTPDEQTELAMALWGPANLDPHGLPRNHGLHDWVLLRLPESVPGQAEAAFRAKYLSAGNGSHWPPVHVRLWMIGTTLEQTKTCTQPFSLTEADVSLMQQMIREWAGAPLLPVTEESSFLVQDKEPNKYRALQGLRTILLSHDLPPEEAEAVWRKVETMENSHDREQIGFILYPALAQKFPERVDALTQRLRRGLVSDDQAVATEAVWGLYSWLHAAQDHALHVPQPPADLVREIGIVIAARRQSILAEVLKLARWLLNEGSEEYRLLIVEECEHGLGCLLEEASYKRTRREAEESDVPLLRRNCIRLALAMARWGYGDHTAVKNWIDAAHEDSLPEVRNAVDGEVSTEIISN